MFVGIFCILYEIITKIEQPLSFILSDKRSVFRKPLHYNYKKNDRTINSV